MHYVGMRKIDVREVLRREFECKVLGIVAIAVEYLEGVAHLLQATGHPDDWDQEEVIKDHLKQIEYYLRSLLEAPKRGKRSKWTGKELERAVRRALIRLPTRERKLDKVAEK